MSSIESLQRHRNLQSGAPDLEFGMGELDSQIPEPKEITEVEYKQVRVIDYSSNDLLTLAAIDIASTVQFPHSTAFLHGLGVLSCAMNKSFKVELYGTELPTGLYVVTSQPPSTGKSGINNYFSIPYRVSMSKLNDKNKTKRATIELKIKEVKEQLKASSSDNERDALISEIQSLSEKLDDTPIYKAALTNPTPEALEVVAFKQKGIFSIISDEAGAIMSALGLTYGDSSKSPNNDMILQGWDGNYFSSARITRENNDGNVFGSISVIAQESTVNAILKQGGRGNGVSERFILCMEPNLLGDRDHMNYKPVDKKLQLKYNKLVHNMVMSDSVTMRLTDDALNYILTKKQEVESHMGDFGKYSDDMIRGFVGKMDKQVVKISAILHAVDNFQEKIGNVLISEDTVRRAYAIFSEIVKLYVFAADQKGYSGINSQLNCVKEALQRQSQKGSLIIKVTILLDNIKKATPWKNQKKIMSYFRAEIMPKMVKMHWCDYSEKHGNGVSHIKISPKL